MIKIPAGKFKAQCLKLMDDVQALHREIVITKHGRPVAKLVPMDSVSSKAAFGCMKGTVVIKGDIVQPTGETWSAGEADA
jgi:prevent-host-death family protein